MDDYADYREIFGRDPEPWRDPLGALRITLMGEPEDVDVPRAQNEVEELVRVINQGANSYWLDDPATLLGVITELRKRGYAVEPGGQNV